MISSIKLHTTGSNSKRLLSDGHFHRTQLGATCLTFVSTSSRVTLATPTKNGGGRGFTTEDGKEKHEKQVQKKNKQRNKQEKQESCLNHCTEVSDPDGTIGDDGLIFFILFIFSASPVGFMAYLITYSQPRFITRSVPRI